MRTLLLLIAIGCTEPSADCPVVGETVLELCGPMPSHPGASAAFDGDTVTMTRTTYDAIEAWRDDVDAWRSCVVSIP